MKTSQNSSKTELHKLKSISEIYVRTLEDIHESLVVSETKVRNACSARNHVRVVNMSFHNHVLAFANLVVQVACFAFMSDTGDELGKSLVAYAENESLNHTTKSSLKEFVESFSGVQDFRDVQVGIFCSSFALSDIFCLKKWRYNCLNRKLVQRRVEVDNTTTTRFS